MARSNVYLGGASFRRTPPNPPAALETGDNFADRIPPTDGEAELGSAYDRVMLARQQLKWRQIRISQPPPGLARFNLSLRKTSLRWTPTAAFESGDNFAGRSPQ